MEPTALDALDSGVKTLAAASPLQSGSSFSGPDSSFSLGSLSGSSGSLFSAEASSSSSSSPSGSSGSSSEASSSESSSSGSSGAPSASSVLVCPSGFVLLGDGSACVGVESGASFLTCPAGFERFSVGLGSSAWGCRRVLSEASVSYSCLEGVLRVSGDSRVCVWEVEEVESAAASASCSPAGVPLSCRYVDAGGVSRFGSLRYGCQSGWVLSGSSCSRTVQLERSASPAAAYSCERGVLVGSSCVEYAQPVRACSPGWVLLASASCERAVRAAAAQSSTSTSTTTTSTSSTSTSTSSTSTSTTVLDRSAGKPRDVSVVAGVRSLSVSWKAPASFGGRTLLGYNVEWSSSWRFGPSPRVAVVGASKLSHVITGLTGGTLYWVRVRAIYFDRIRVSTNYAQGTPTDPTATTTTTAVPIGRPSMPQGLKVAPGSVTGTMVVSWDAPLDDGGSPVTHYTIRWKRVYRGLTTTTFGPWSALLQTTRRTFTAYTGISGVSYFVSVWAHNAEQKSWLAGVSGVTACPFGTEYRKTPEGCEPPCGAGEVYNSIHRGCRPSACPNVLPVPNTGRRDASGYCQLNWPSSVVLHPEPPPDYSRLTCSDYKPGSTAEDYLDFDEGDASPTCPPMGLFLALGERRRVVHREADYYFPVWADSHYHNEDHNNQNKDFGDRNHGKIIVRSGGDCSGLRDTDTEYDFQVPCKAHDYCYDLTRVGLHRTVGTGNCDRTFRELLSAHCYNRADVWILQCHSVAMRPKIGTQLAGVSPEPGRVRIRNVSTGKCLALSVPWSRPPRWSSRWSSAGRVPVVQKSCAAGDVDQQFYVVQAGDAGSGNYVIKPVSSSVADAGLGAGNTCLTTSVGRDRPSRGIAWSLTLVLERESDCSTSRECPLGYPYPFILSSPGLPSVAYCEYKVMRYGSLNQEGTSCSPSGRPPSCVYSESFVIPATDELFVSDVQAPVQAALVSLVQAALVSPVGFPAHEYELRLAPSGVRGVRSPFCWAPDPRGEVVTESGGRASLSRMRALVQADGVGIRGLPCSTGALTIGDRLTRWRFEPVAWTPPSLVRANATVGPVAASILVYWKPPVSDGGYPIESYTITWGLAPAGGRRDFPQYVESVTVPVSSLSLTTNLPGLDNPRGVSYYTYVIRDLAILRPYVVGVTATNSAGFSGDLKDIKGEDIGHSPSRRYGDAPR